jgi:hypothetical protein
MNAGLQTLLTSNAAPDHCRVGFDGLFIQRDVWRTFYSNGNLKTDNETLLRPHLLILYRFNLYDLPTWPLNSGR